MDAPTSSNSSEASEKCQVCFQPSHGRHFGASTCRACAAFFRRYNVPKKPETSTREIRCRQKENDCKPHGNGRWYCKKCRLNRCMSIGMSPENIQLDRDIFSSATSVEVARKREHSSVSTSQNGKKPFAGPSTVPVPQSEIDLKQDRSYVDLSHLIDIVSNILETPPILDKKTKKMNTLARLAYGLKQIRMTQMTENIGRMEKIGKEETVGLWEQEITKAARWLMYSEEFNALSHTDKFTVVKCMWHLFSRLERIAMTAEMRMKKLCGPRQFIVSHTQLIDFETCKVDVGWITDQPLEKLMFFLGPISTWFNDQQVSNFIELQPSDMELTFLLCNLCFQLTGKRFSGPIEEFTDNFQDWLANDLHKYYVETDSKKRYSHRLLKLLNINKEYQMFMHRRHESAVVGDIFKVFKINFSHPEMFHYSC